MFKEYCTREKPFGILSMAADSPHFTGKQSSWMFSAVFSTMYFKTT